MQGNMLELIFHAPYGQHEFKWQKQYGRVYSIKGCIGVSQFAEILEHNSLMTLICLQENRLMVSDPMTLRHILADTDNFRKCPQHQLINRRVFGDGSVLSAEGEWLQWPPSIIWSQIRLFAGADHRRLRNIMLPAFSMNALRPMVPKLQIIAEEV